MSTLPEVIGLFSDLALHLQNGSQVNRQYHQQEHENSSLDLSISKLAQSLNITGIPGVRVLDTVLSLMCFTAPQVFESVTEYYVNTIVSVMNSSVNCKVVLSDNEETLQIGSSIPRRDFVELLNVVHDIVSKLDCQGVPSHPLLSAAIRAAVSTTCCRYLDPLVHISDVPSFYGSSTAVSKMLCHLPQDISLENHGIPLRLLFWYLNPFNLKHDISEILQESMKRPFLSLSKEFYGRMDWRSILICLVLSPAMFIETRALLHDWFLLTGLGSVLDVLVELVSMMLEVISGPTCWGLSMGLGSKLPFLSAYFPYKPQALRALAGSVCPENFLLLVHGINESVPLDTKQRSPTIRLSTSIVASTDSRSIWSLAINFPDWCHYASVLLFHGNQSSGDIFQLKWTNEVIRVGQEYNLMEPPAAAARYIAWILSPVDRSYQDKLFDTLIKVSNYWTLKQVGSGTHEKRTSSLREKLKQSKISDSKQDFTVGNGHDCQVIGFCLRQLQNVINGDDESVDSSAPCKAKTFVHIPQYNMLLRKIPLGILIGGACLNEHGCEMLLQYVVTGRILDPVITGDASSKRKMKISVEPGNSVAETNECHRKDAITAVNLVFGLTDIVERLSTISESKEIALEFICQMKIRTCGYLIKYISRLMLPPVDEDEVLLLTDLRARMEQWKHQGDIVLQLDKDIEKVIRGLSHILSP